MNKSKIGALIAAAALTLTFAGTVLANDLAQGTPISGADFDKRIEGCGEGWHFVHTDTDGSNLPATLTAVFQNAGEVTAEGYSNGNGNGIVMYDVTGVADDDTLLSASDTISNEGLLNLSHICFTTTTTTDTETTDTETTDTETTDTETTETETSPDGSVEELTPPSTDTIAASSSTTVSTGLLLVLAGILAAVLVVVPAAARSRR